MPSITEAVIKDQFTYLREHLNQDLPELPQGKRVFIGCGTSYYLAQTLAAVSNMLGQPAVAAPSADWMQFPGAHLATTQDAVVIGLSRSGSTTETVAAIKSSRSQGHPTVAISCEKDSAIINSADAGIYLPTDPREGIVMTVSASLMLLAGLRLLGVPIGEVDINAAQSILEVLENRSDILDPMEHFVFLGGGPLYGIACEGALKLMEMSINPAQPFHPMEYRHGPVSLIGDRSLVVMLYTFETSSEEVLLTRELQQKGARVIGLGGPGDIEIGAASKGGLTDAIRYLPALQLLGERAAVARAIDTETPRHLTKVVILN